MSEANRHHCADFGALDASRYQTREMADDERTAYERHAGTCVVCRAAADRQRRLDDLIAQLPTYRTPDTLPARRRPVSGRRAAIGLLAAAAILLLLLLVAPDRRADRALIAGASHADTVMRERASVVLKDAPRRRVPEAEAEPWLGFIICADWIMPDVDGIYLCALDPDGPLAGVGAEPGDVLVEVDGQHVADDAALDRVLGRHRIGDRVWIKVRGGDRFIHARVPLVARVLGARHPFDLEWSPALRASLSRTAPGRVDVDDLFVPVPDSTAVRLGVPAGMLVTETPTREQSRGTLLNAVPYLFGPGGLRAGDVITAVEHYAIVNNDDLWLAFMDVQYGPFTITVRRGGEHLRLRFEPEP